MKQKQFYNNTSFILFFIFSLFIYGRKYRDVFFDVSYWTLDWAGLGITFTTESTKN